MPLLYTAIDLSDSRLTGTIPSEIAKCRTLKLLLLLHNDLTGSVPEEICTNFPNIDVDLENEVRIDCDKVQCSCNCTCIGV